LCRVATNACYDRLRKRKPELPGEMADHADGRVSADAALAERQRWDAVQAAMMTLPQPQRAAMALRYDQALPQREAAAVLGVGEKAYEALLVRARKTLRAALKESEHA
ncbi:MAG: sigma factor-like helix-turn-helix DNA-binding protein, partial [Litorimonas sp.]